MKFLYAYASQHDLCDERIALKVRYTLEVAQLCDEVARDERLSAAAFDLAWLCGLLHVIIRIERLRKWGTLSDVASRSDVMLGLEILEGELFRYTSDVE